MALETLTQVERIDGFEVSHYPQKPNSDFVLINHDTNTIAFTIQNGAIKENDVNGCQVDTMIRASQMIIEGLNSKFPCEENEKVIECLREALKQLKSRKEDRKKRNVEGYEKN